MKDLIHKRVRAAFEEWAARWGSEHDVTTAFEVEDFETGPASGSVTGYNPDVRITYRKFVDYIDWGDSAQASRVIRVFEDMLLWWVPDREYDQQDWGAEVRQIERALHINGYLLLADNRIVRSTFPLGQLPTEVLSDPSAMREHMDRLHRTGDVDPPLAIGEAKSLVEATCKAVLTELTVSFGPTDDVPALVKRTQKSLGLHPDDIAPTARGQDSSKKVLGSLAGVVVGIAELRNALGTGHGKATAVLLSPRHAHLAVGAAGTYCRFLLETLSARRADIQP